MSALGDALLEMLPLLVALGLLHDVVNWAARISFGVSVQYFDVYDAIGAWCPESSDAYVASVGVGGGRVYFWWGLGVE